MAFIFQTKIFKCPLSNRHSRPIAVIENMDMLVRNHPTADLHEFSLIDRKSAKADIQQGTKNPARWQGYV